MNKYEQYMRSKLIPIQYVKYWLSMHRAWCHIDELIANPAIFPEQTWPLRARLNWAKEVKQAGYSWVISHPGPQAHLPGAEFAIEACKEVPAMRYRHISKVWRLANESV